MCCDEKRKLIQEIYSALEEISICDGVPGVGEWIMNALNKEYEIILDFNEEIYEVI